MKIVKFYTPDEKPMPLGKRIVCVTEHPLYGDLTFHPHVVWSELAWRESTGDEVVHVDGHQFDAEDRAELLQEGFTIELDDLGPGRVDPSRVVYWAHLVEDLGLDDE